MAKYTTQTFPDPIHQPAAILAYTSPDPGERQMLLIFVLLRGCTSFKKGRVRECRVDVILLDRRHCLPGFGIYSYTVFISTALLYQLVLSLREQSPYALHLDVLSSMVGRPVLYRG